MTQQRITDLLEIPCNSDSVTLLGRLRDVPLCPVELHQACRCHGIVAARRDILAIRALNVRHSSQLLSARLIGVIAQVEGCTHLAHAVEHRRGLDDVNVIVQVARQAVRQRADRELARLCVAVCMICRGQHGLDFGEGEKQVYPVSSGIAGNLCIDIDTMRG